MKKILCLFLLICSACALQKKEPPVYTEGTDVVISGTITIIGNEPFTKMALRPADGKPVLILAKDFYTKNKNLINTSIKISGRISVKELISADGKYRNYEYTLTNPILIQK